MFGIYRKYIFLGVLMPVCLIICILPFLGYFFTCTVIPNPSKLASEYLTSHTPYTVNIQEISGNFNSGFLISELTISSDSKTIANINNFSIKLKLLSLFTGKLHISKTSLTNGDIFLDNINKVKTGLINESVEISRNTKFEIEKFDIQSLRINDNRIDTLIVNMSGNLEYSDSLLVSIDTTVVKHNQNKSYIHNAIFTLSNNSFKLNNVEFDSDMFSTLTGNINISSSKRVDGSFDEIKLSGYSSINEHIVDSINLQIKIQPDHFQLINSRLLYNERNVNIEGMYNLPDKSWNFTAIPENVKIELDSLICIVDGKFNLSGQQPDFPINISFDNTKAKINDHEIDLINGEFLLSDSSIVNSSKIEIKIPNCTFLFDTVNYNFGAEYFVHGQMAFGSLFPKKYIDELPAMSFTGVGDINYVHNNELSELNTRITLKPFYYNNLYVGDSFWETSAEIENKTLKNLSLSAKADSIQLEFLSMDNSNITAEYKDGIIRLNELIGINSRGESFYASGMIDTSFQKIALDSLSTKIRSINITSSGIDVYRDQDYYLIDSTRIDINDGYLAIAGKYLDRDQYNLNIGLSDISLEEINDFFQIDHNLTGKIDGEFEFINSNDKPVMVLKAEVNNGVIKDIPFSTLYGNMIYRDNRLVLTELSVQSSSGFGQTSGWINIDSSFEEDKFLDNINSMLLEISLSDANLSDFSKYFPWRLKTSGNVDGYMIASGNPKDLFLNSNITIQNPQFDEIIGVEAIGNLVYQDKKLFFHDTSIKLNHGKYDITGNIPLNLDLVYDEKFSMKNKSMNLSISGTAEELEFFYPYFEIVDSLKCDCTLQLSLDGTYANPIRNGQVIINDGKVNVLPLKNSIVDIESSISIDDNLLTINTFDAKVIDDNAVSNRGGGLLSLFKKDKRKVKTEERNLHVSGTMDLTRFFEPNFNLVSWGKDIYLNDSQSEFSGPGEVQLSLTGRDTLLVSGIFEPDSYDFLLTPLFDIEDLPEVDIRPGRIIIIYDINIPMENGIRVENDIMDLEVEGDVTITAIGNENFRFAGTVSIVDGTFYLNGNEFSQVEGQMTFDPSSEYPFIDLISYIDLNGTQYKILFTGSMENPVLGFESELPGDSYSQDEILRILLARDDSAASGDNFSLQNTSTSILSNYVENELERYISKNSPIDKFQINSDGSLLADPTNSDINLYLGKRLSRKIYMNIKSDIFSEQVRNEYEVIYKIDKNKSLVVRLDEDGLPHVKYRFKQIY